MAAHCFNLVQNSGLRIGAGGGILILLVVLIGWVMPYYQNSYKLNRFPGPVLAGYTRLWSFWKSRNHLTCLSVHDEHMKHGDFVRLSPTHVSISHPDSIREILGHGNGFAKSDFYYAFDNIEQGIFTTRDRAKHTRKRRFVSHIFSPKAMIEFEPYMTIALGNLGRQMDSLIDTARAGAYVSWSATDPMIAQHQRKGEAALDAAVWSAFLAFDIIGDLAVGEPFGFVEAGYDSENRIKKLRDRGEWCATVGMLPWIKTWTPYFYFDSFFTKGLKAAQGLAEMGIACVEKRKAVSIDPNRKDILYYLLTAKDPDKGGPIPDGELKAEALTQLIAGSDTTGNTITHLTDMLTRNPAKLKILQEELDTAFPDPQPQDFVASFVDCKDLPYVQAVIYETLRLRTTVSMGLPRVVGEGGATVCGERFEEGTVLSTATYTTHRDPRIWGSDSWDFKPERWLGRGQAELEKYFLGFSQGPRACIGRNVAFMELKKTVATVFRRFEYRLIYPDRESWLREGFHLKCQELPVFIRRRTPAIAEKTALATS
ncbi:cytochrome P450 3A3 [Exophiala viscosa]|uniref:Cytochrome P450 3A3 n=1 Tax=Exophiala viscosa TaxID=2486360 RepID=A0AAN6IFX5_9EURO|nr:cytochrome P450 3A3 [Exophiala viscosa]